MKLVYTGPHQAVQIAATGQTAAHGTPVDVRAEVAERLLEQAHWSKATGKSKNTSTDSDEE